MAAEHHDVVVGFLLAVVGTTGFIVELGRWVLDRACRRLAAWKRRDPQTGLRIAVNTSARHLAEGDLERLAGATALATVAPAEAARRVLAES